MIRKVGYIFVTLDGKVKGDVQGVDTVCCTIFMMTDLAATLQVQVWRVYRNVSGRV